MENRNFNLFQWKNESCTKTHTIFSSDLCYSVSFTSKTKLKPVSFMTIYTHDVNKKSSKITENSIVDMAWWLLLLYVNWLLYHPYTKMRKTKQLTTRDECMYEIKICVVFVAEFPIIINMTWTHFPFFHSLIVCYFILFTFIHFKTRIIIVTFNTETDLNWIFSHHFTVSTYLMKLLQTCARRFFFHTDTILQNKHCMNDCVIWTFIFM